MIDVKQALSNLKPPEERLKNWNNLLPKLFELEQRLLEDLMRNESIFKSAETDLEKKEAIIFADETRYEILSEIDPMIKSIQTLIDRLKLIEQTYTNYRYGLFKDMDNAYYGKSKDGKEIWSKGKPPVN